MEPKYDHELYDSSHFNVQSNDAKHTWSKFHLHYFLVLLLVNAVGVAFITYSLKWDMIHYLILCDFPNFLSVYVQV